MITRRRWWMALMVVALVVAACGAPSDQDGGAARDGPSNPTTPPTSKAVDVESMPDLVGLSSAEAGRRLGELGLGSESRTVTVRCEARPGTVVRQSPAPGAALTDGTQVRLGIGTLDLEEFRGPCDPADADLGPVTGPDAALARGFYRFAADPSLGAPFVDADVWTGIEDGLVATTVSPAQRADLDAWLLDGEYAEQGGPFSALDVLASSGGYFELHRGIVGTCPAGDDDPPPDLAGMRAISLTVPEGSIDSCMKWWAVTLFLEGDQIRGVALRIGSP